MVEESKNMQEMTDMDEIDAEEIFKCNNSPLDYLIHPDAKVDV